LKTLHSSPQRGCDLEVQNHYRLDQDIRLFDVMPITTEDEIFKIMEQRMKFKIMEMRT